MRRKTLWFGILALVLFALFLFGCSNKQSTTHLDVTGYGVLPSNSGIDNSRALQALIDSVWVNGAILYFPAGEYQFAENGQQTIGSHCIKMRSNITILGCGNATVLKPVGASQFGLDLFYFNDYLDTGNANYLENCSFQDFVIDGSDTSCDVYTSAGKGFMFNLFRNCHWNNVTVRYTDATGFGVDCPIGSSMTHCSAIGCGKGATKQSTGASGFGIGYGFSPEESMTITDCHAEDNAKFGFFFEHQGRFDSSMYNAQGVKGFCVSDCTASNNLYNFGAVQASFGEYRRCSSENANEAGYFFENSDNFVIDQCTADRDGRCALAVVQTEEAAEQSAGTIYVSACGFQNVPIGIVIHSQTAQISINNIQIDNCEFSGIGEYTLWTQGNIRRLTLTGNRSDRPSLCLNDEITDLINENNSWNVP